MPAGASEPCGQAGSSTGLVWDHQPPTSCIPAPAAAWRSMGMPCCCSWTCSLVCWGEAGQLGNELGASAVALFMVELVQAPRCLLGWETPRCGGTRSVCSARGEGDRKAPEGFVTSTASLIRVLGTGCWQPIGGMCRLPDARFLDGLMAPSSRAPSRRRGEHPGHLPPLLGSVAAASGLEKAHTPP